MAAPVYDGEFSEKEATRLLWRAGFGPRPGEAKALSERGLSKAVGSLLNPPKAALIGPAPHDEDGNFAPYDLWGHDLLWWLDKMVRSNQPLVERMALNWHDWFATGDVSSARLSIKQAKLFRKKAFERFDRLIEDVTTDPAMLIWLSGIDNNKWNPNENYGRELMELFTLGVSDETGYPYTEDDVREQARALTGWRADWREDVGYENFRFDNSYHDISRTRVEPGPAIIQYHNTGEDPHDLKVKRKGGGTIFAIGVTEPGLVGSISIARLRADSRYRLWCTLEGHAEAGMDAILRVAKRTD